MESCTKSLCPTEKADRLVRSFTSDPGHGLSAVFAACLDAGANPNSTVATGEEADGWTPLLLTAYGAFNDASRQPNDSIWNAASLEQTKLLLEHGADLNAKTPKGEDALYLASVAGRIPLMELFLSKGISVNNRTEEGRTPLYGALLYGRVDVVTLLLEKGADPNVVSIANESILDLATMVAEQVEREGIKPTKNYDPKSVFEILKKHGAKSAIDLGRSP